MDPFSAGFFMKNAFENSFLPEYFYDSPLLLQRNILRSDVHLRIAHGSRATTASGF